MKIIRLFGCGFKNHISSETLLKMKLTITLLIAAFFQVHAIVYSQKINISLKNAKLDEVFTQIMNQTNYEFVYFSQALKDTKPVDIVLVNATLQEALDKCFAGQPLSYVVNENTVVVQPKDLPPPPITGIITNEKGETLPGANVIIKGSNIGVATDANGNFSINAKIGDILVISFLGYDSQQIKLTSFSNITIILKATNSVLNEIVVMGYTQKRASELTGSVQIVTAQDLSKSITTPDAISALKGRVTGVDIINSNPMTAVKAAITIRGQGSFTGGVDPVNGFYSTGFYVQTGPLIVIDGVITQFTSIAQAVSVNDIETVTLLKDAASTAIYGSRAAAGVLLVTTKKGMAGKMKINVNLKSGINFPNFGNVEMMNTSQWLQQSRDAASIAWVQEPSYQEEFPNGYMDLWKNKLQGVFGLFDTTYSFDWQRNVFRPGILINATVNVSGGDANSNYYVGISTYNENGNDLVSKYKQNSIRVKLEQRLAKFFKVGMNINGNFENQTNSLSSPEFLMEYYPFYNPYLEGKNSDTAILKTWRGEGSTVAAGYDLTVGNPFFENRYNNTMIKNINLMGSFFGKISFTPWLDFVSTNTWSKYRNDLNSIADRRTVLGGYMQPNPRNGSLTVNAIQNDVFLTSNQLNFRKTFNKYNNVSALAGQEYQYKKLNTYSIYKSDVMAGERNPSAGSSDYNGYYHSPATGFVREYLIYSLFSQVDYSFKERYLFSGSVRRDASASYSPEGRYKTFWSLSGGWIVSEEKLWESIRNTVSFLKFRASYGISGKDAGADFLNQSLYGKTAGAISTDYLSKGTSGYFIYQLGNDFLTWETTNATEAGVDVALFRGRVSANFSYYEKAGKNLLIQAQYSSISGVPAQYQNIGDLTNKGWELTLNTLNISHKAFSWSTAFTTYHNSNRIEKIRPPASADDVPELPVFSTYWSYGYAGSYKVGESLNDIKVVKFLRFEKETGYPVFEHVSDEDGSKTEVVITPNSVFENLLGNPASYQKIGSSAPKIQGGLINEFRYKNFGLGITLTYAFGSKVVSRGLEHSGVLLNENLVYWKPGSPDNDKANVPKPGSAYYFASDYSSLIWVNGDAVKIANVRFSYDLPQNILNKLKISSLQIALSADNLKYFTNKYYLGADPEMLTYQGSGNDSGGFGSTNYNPGLAASPRRVNLSLNFGF